MSAVIEIARALVVSTGHIRHDDAKRLADSRYRGLVRSFDYGWTLYVAGDLRLMVHLDDLSADAIRCVELAKAHGCEWLTLDQDGPYVDGLAQFHW